MKIAIVGAGLAGLSAAAALQARGHAVTVFEKARGVGGRLAQRRGDQAAWDLGAQYFTSRAEEGSAGGPAPPRVGAAFDDQLQHWLAAGCAARWPARIATRRGGDLQAVDDGVARYVGVPAMQTLARALLGGFELRLQTRVRPWTPDGSGRHALHDEAGQALGRYEQVLLTTPPEQAVELLAAFPAAREQAARVRLLPCFALYLQLPQALAAPCDALFGDGQVLSWLALEDSKPGRTARHCWTAHAAAQWSMQHLESPPADLLAPLLEAFFQQLGCAPRVPVQAGVQRWRYAIAQPPLDCRAWFDPQSGIALAGDWLAGNRVAGAWHSGQLAAALLG